MQAPFVRRRARRAWHGILAGLSVHHRQSIAPDPGQPGTARPPGAEGASGPGLADGCGCSSLSHCPRRPRSDLHCSPRATFVPLRLSLFVLTLEEEEPEERDARGGV